MPESPFEGFPGLAKATAIPNVFFSEVLPAITDAGELLAFLWTARLAQERRGETRFVSADDIWSEPGAAASFTALDRGRAGLVQGLEQCAERGVLLALHLVGSVPEEDETVYFVNTPEARRTVARAQSGELVLKPRRRVVPASAPNRPDIFRIYEDHIGTVTPLVGERLMEAQGRYPWPWIEDAFREAAVMNIRNWRYVARILENMEREGRGRETTGRDSLEERERRYLGGARGPIRPA